MTATTAARPDRKFLATIGEELSASLLVGDETFSKAALADAASFVLRTARERAAGEPAIALESVTGSPEERLTRIAVVNDDMPFLVDSIAAAIDALGLSIDRLLHPIVGAARDAKGVLTDISGDPATGTPESIVYVETARADARCRVRLRASLDAVLEDVRAAVTDWPKMQAALTADADRLAEQSKGDSEGAALLRWFQGGMLTQLGHVVRKRGGRNGQRLGICRSGTTLLPSEESVERAFAWFDSDPALAPLILKSDDAGRVHRRVPPDVFIVPIIEEGKVVALSVHIGLWTSAALAAPPNQVPILRTQLGALMEKFGFDPRGHDGKALVHALAALPHDLLIAFDLADLERAATAMMSLIDRPRPRILLVRSPLERHLCAFVWLPRDTLSNALRREIQSMIESAADAPVIDWAMAVEGGLSVLRFIADIDDEAATPDEAALDQQLRTIVRGWPAAVEAELVTSETPARAAAIAARYAEAFPLGYRTAYGPAEAAADIHRLHVLPADGGDAPQRRDARFHIATSGTEGELQLKLYQRQGSLPLSDAVPMLENFGFRVLGEIPTLLDDGKLGAIHDFRLALPHGLARDDLLARAADIETAVAGVLNGEAENDPFNRLITAIGLSAREANWMRAWFRYLRQTGLTFAIATVVDALQNAAQVTRGLIDLFLARHDPEQAKNRDKAEECAAKAIEAGLQGVSAINDDRLLRRYRAVIEAMLRTNAFSTAPDTALAFKLDSALVPGLPKPVPWREIFVYSQRVEGIHLRAGPIARGGLRWSDRRDDFRTEVLGLMKAQRVKNAVIVPTGAKGGFYPKHLPNPALDREGWANEGRESYRVFVRSLLALTDNIVGAKVVHPPHMVIRDGDDPYFVVAADKGTASFSDTANALAAEKDFWLDDAFASGGSKGYDHKAMGITARGAWLSVQRHFLELGTDVQKQSVRVAGCGDMSGDVFGNGMLLSKKLKLVAAFDHRHIFLDPDPDPAKSWTERNRLFALPRSSWDDYDKKLISKGGGVFPRSQKSIPLSREVRAALAIEDSSTDPDSLITAVLKSQVDLLWFGGIGTYVKAAAENNIEVGDPANDALRVNGDDIRAKVIGEGANLGCTQAGRIEFALHGGRINTDFIDNSAGVDCSDNEVNIKIALAAAKRSGRLTENARVKLLTAMTDSVAALVLEDNRLQALALSVAEARGPAAMPAWLRLIELLEAGRQLDRKTEGLADNETLARRVGDGKGLTRPELAVLLSSSKLALQHAFEHSALPDDPGLADDLVASFPPEMHRKFHKEILSHRLRREIIATELANRLVNRLGLVHPFELIEEENASPAQLGAAFVAAERLFGMADIWQQIESAAMPEAARVLLIDRAAAGLRPHIAELLRAGAGPVPPSQLARELEKGIAQISALTADLVGSETKAQSDALHQTLTSSAAPEAQAAMVCRLFDLDGAVGIARLAGESRIAAPVLGRAFVDIGVRLGLDWAQGMAARMNPSDPWERLAVSGLARDFQQMRLDFLRRTAGRRSDPGAVVASWAEAQAGAIAQFRAMVTRAQTSPTISAAMLTQLAGQARSLLAR
jgi:glutamate dehydrogenase